MEDDSYQEDPPYTPPEGVEGMSLPRIDSEVGSKDKGKGEVDEVGNGSQDVKERVCKLRKDAVWVAEEKLVLNTREDDIVGG